MKIPNYDKNKKENKRALDDFLNEDYREYYRGVVERQML